MTFLKETVSLCPQCHSSIPARIIEKDAAVWMEKKCPEHGLYTERISVLPEYYKKRQNWIGPGVVKGRKKSIDNCPFICEHGLCKDHIAEAYNVFIDITNKCNLKCPVCFVNIDKNFVPIEPPFTDIAKIIKRWAGCRITLHFIGGEPTLRKDLPQMISLARSSGIKDIQVCTNGVRLVDIDYMKSLFEAGLRYIFLSIDGIHEDTYSIMKGNPRLLEDKMRVIENIKKLKKKDKPLIFSVTATEHNIETEIPNIISLAQDHYEYVRMIVVLTESFCGKNISEEQRINRITDSHIIKTIQRYMGDEGRVIPLSVLSYGTALLTKLFRGSSIFPLPNHPECDSWIIWLYDYKRKRLKNVLSFFSLSVDEFYWKLRDIYERTTKISEKSLFMARVYAVIRLLGFLRFLKNKTILLAGLQRSLIACGLHVNSIVKKGWKKVWRESRRKYFGFAKPIFLQIVPFSDLYNIDVEKCRYCSTFYSLVHPETGKVCDLPFCTINNIYRAKFEEMARTK